MPGATPPRNKKPENNPQWVMFAKVFVDTNDYAEASLAAQYRCKDRKGHYSNGQKVARNPKVLGLIEHERKVKLASLGLTREATFERVARLAHFDLSRFIKVSPDGQPYYDFSEATKEELQCIAELGVEFYVEGRGEFAQQIKRVKIKGHDQAKYLDMWNRMCGHYQKDNEQGADALIAAIQRGRERVAKEAKS